MILPNYSRFRTVQVSISFIFAGMQNRRHREGNLAARAGGIFFGTPPGRQTNVPQAPLTSRQFCSSSLQRAAPLRGRRGTL